MRSLSKDTQLELTVQAQCPNEKSSAITHVTCIDGKSADCKRRLLTASKAVQKQTRPSPRGLEAWRGPQATDLLLCVHPGVPRILVSLKYSCGQAPRRKAHTDLPSHNLTWEYTTVFRRGQQTHLTLHVALRPCHRKMAGPVLRKGEV